VPYQVFGEGPAIVFGNGIGVRYPGLALQIAALRDRFRFVTWDYRGQGPSVLGGPGADVSMGRQAEDALAVLDRLGIERAIFAGWSMGVQVALEAIRRAPERAAGFAAVLGGFGRTFREAFPAPVARAVEGLFALGVRVPRVAQLPLDLAVALPDLAFAVLTRALFVGADADRRVFDGNVAWVARTDRRTYLRTMQALADHDASDVLPRVRCPALIVCGTRDRLTPPAVGRRMAREIPGADYREIAGGTHFALIEQPDLLNGWLRAFADRAYGGAPGLRTPR
jgi:pimeloyl-ACP methyl ester carboxylesterase